MSCCHPAPASSPDHAVRPPPRSNPVGQPAILRESQLYARKGHSVRRQSCLPVIGLSLSPKAQPHTDSYSKTPSVICSPRLANLSCTYRAAALLHPGSGINKGFPDVAVGALPPDSPVAARSHLIRRQSAVESWVPFPRHLRLQRCQIIEATQHLPIHAVGTAGTSSGAGRNHRHIAVS